MDIDHPHAQICCRPAGRGGGVGDIVELEIKKNGETTSLQTLDHPRASAGTQLLANLEAAWPRVQLRGQRRGSLGVVQIQRHHYSGLFNATRRRRYSPSTP